VFERRKLSERMHENRNTHEENHSCAKGLGEEWTWNRSSCEGLKENHYGGGGPEEKLTEPTHTKRTVRGIERTIPEL